MPKGIIIQGSEGVDSTELRRTVELRDGESVLVEFGGGTDLGLSTTSKSAITYPDGNFQTVVLDRPDVVNLIKVLIDALTTMDASVVGVEIDAPE